MIFGLSVYERPSELSSEPSPALELASAEPKSREQTAYSKRLHRNQLLILIDFSDLTT